MARGMKGAHPVVLLCTFTLLFFGDVYAQISFNEITGFSLSPPYFNLAEGSRISATATCGEDEAGRPRTDLYCKLVGGPSFGLPSQTIQGQYCDRCNSNDPNKAHPVSNAIDGTERWWQSPPLSRGPIYNEVNVTLDLGQLFHVAYVLIKFANAPRPDLWVLERSLDYGKTYTPWQYFAHSKRECIERFGKQPNGRIVQDDDQICTTEYSKIVPLENGEIVVSLVNGRPGSKNFTYSPVLRDFTKATNIRMRFLRTNTLLGHLISKAQRDRTVTRRYYYSIKDVSVGGRCVCHGHAQVCGRRDQGNRLHCECTHNTCGESCDRCCPGFNQKPWRAATTDSPNECQPCQCHSHATECYYDPVVEQRRASLDTFGRYDGGGVCINCQHNTAGVNCELCAVGFYRPHGVPPESHGGCVPCRCSAWATSGCEMGTGRCLCRPEFTGNNCERCADGYYGYPQCISAYHFQLFRNTGSVPEVCDALGNCICRYGVEGKRCDRCQPGYHSFPYCQVTTCRCEGAGVTDRLCGPNGKCLCHANYMGLQCDQCAPGYYGYPDCVSCECSEQGSYESKCAPVSGQCLCRPGAVGRRCDRCIGSDHLFPLCLGDIHLSFHKKHRIWYMWWKLGSPPCLPNVQGVLCDICRPLYWNLAIENPRGCIECQCEVKGTLSGLGECQQKSGQCYCKPNMCSHTCDTCKEGFYLLQKKNYFGCQGCQCDVGGAVNMWCDQMSGQCRCRNNVVGRTCTEPVPNYYFPSLHHLRYEVEDGITPNARPVRFGYNPQEFPEFSWRGYAVMSPAQPEVILSLAVGFPGTFHIVFRYVTSTPPRPTQGRRQRGRVRARILVVDEPGFHSCCDWEGQSEEVVFPSSSSPSYVTVPGDGFADPFTLTPGKWTIRIRAQGVLLDYLVLLPSDYYEAPILQEKITQPCTYTSAADRDTNCLLYKHVTLNRFSSVLGTQGQLPSPRRRRPTADHPDMASLTGRQLSLRVPMPGPYVLVLEYASEVDMVQNVNLIITDQSESRTQARANIYSCQYSFLCRGVAVDGTNRLAVFQLTHKAELVLLTSTASLLLYKVYAVPLNEFSMEYVEPKVLCISVNGRFTEDRRPGDFLLHCYVNASLCLRVSCCREVVVAESRISLDLRKRDVVISLKVPPGKTLTLVSWVNATRSNVHLYLLSSQSPVTSSQFCRDSARSLVAAYNDGALPCSCDPSGSTGPGCDPAGGQCPCRPYVIGRQCSRCATGYYGFPYCRPCECGQRLCDEVTGKCICPPQTVKPACRVCETQTFSYHPLVGCEGCDCSPTGVRANAGMDCDRQTGQCKPRIGGRQCDRCAAGFYRFPECVRCDCNQAGVTADVCHPDTGQCLCRRNVQGVRCDACKDGSFHLNPSNPTGCTRCFCFGATDQCQSSTKRRGKFVDMRGWRLVRADQDEVASVLNPSSNTLVADVQELPDTTQLLHWVAPPSYLGDRVCSKEAMVVSLCCPQSRDMTLVHTAPQTPDPDRLYQGRVQLVEGKWRHAGTNRPVSRGDLMMVLAELEDLRVRALYFTQSQRLSLGEVGLEEATDLGAGGPASTVEKCDCPPLYEGNSCQKCAPGYYRESSGASSGRCVPCSCNGLASQCDQRTGKCLNCQYNTAGDRCERCKEGYYGDAAKRSCRICPCPYKFPSNSFAVGCSEVVGGVRCDCRTGYAGQRCEQCAPGYYGEPMEAGGSCRPCECRGNRNSCDSRTGGECEYLTVIQKTRPFASLGSLTLLIDFLPVDLIAKLNQSGDGVVPSENLAKILAEAEHMVKEMQKRNFNPQKDAAEEEKDEAQKRKTYVWSTVSREYEQLAAQLDGARINLTVKVNTLSQASAKEDLVKRAEEHAKMLSELAMELEDAVKNASNRSDVRNAMKVIDAYKNIIDAVNEAEKAANEAKDAADKALTVMKKLLNTIPNLEDKINEVEDLSTQLPIANISENINRIKELIEQARDAANRVVVPMKFNGASHVELRTPRDMDDLKAYTALSMSLSLSPKTSRGDGTRRRRQSTDDGNMFVLYLGNRNVSGLMTPGLVWKPNHCPTEVLGTGNVILISYPALTFNLIRIYENAEVIFTKMFTSTLPEQPVKTTSQGNVKKNLLNLDPSDMVFYVGAFSSTYHYSNYTGCIELSIFNDRFISLYNFKNAVNVGVFSSLQGPFFNHVCHYYYDDQTLPMLCGVCAVSVKAFLEEHWFPDRIPEKSKCNCFCVILQRYNITTQPLKGCVKNIKINDKFAPIVEKVGVSRGCPMDFLVSVPFLMNVFSHIAINIFSSLSLTRPIFSLDVRTKSSKGLLFYAATRRGSSHMALYMSKGRIRLSVGKMKEIFHREKYNDGKWHSVSGLPLNTQDGQFTNNKAVSMELTSPLYLGSLLPTHSVIGCVRNFKVNGTHMPEPTTNRGAGPCFNGSPQLGAYFSGRGAHVIINDSFVVGTTFEAVFDIRPRSLNGVLLHVGNSGRPGHGHNARHHLSLYMRRGEVRLPTAANSLVVESRWPSDLWWSRNLNTCTAARWIQIHPMVKRNNVVEMHVDNEGDHKIGPTSSSSTLTKDPLYVGGIAGVYSGGEVTALTTTVK
uniref:Laminin subunit alpha 3 n=1 Tax=Esox lucius TaxID=8010 RepID=A0AAY5K1A5_ESOLU